MGSVKRKKRDSIIQKFMVPIGYQNKTELRHKGSMCTYVPTCCSFLSLQIIIIACSHYLVNMLHLIKSIIQYHNMCLTSHPPPHPFKLILFCYKITSGPVRTFQTLNFNSVHQQMNLLP